MKTRQQVESIRPDKVLVKTLPFFDQSDLPEIKSHFPTEGKARDSTPHFISYLGKLIKYLGTITAKKDTTYEDRLAIKTQEELRKLSQALKTNQASEFSGF